MRKDIRRKKVRRFLGEKGTYWPTSGQGIDGSMKRGGGVPGTRQRCQLE